MEETNGKPTDTVIVSVTEDNIQQAGKIHSESWKKSHEAFCSHEFVEKHTSDRQTEYLRQKISKVSVVYMLATASIPVAVVSVTGSLIEDLYVLPEYQHKGYGTELLHFAVSKCGPLPRLWILENNDAAYRFYLKNGFHFTGNRNIITNGLDELEMSL